MADYISSRSGAEIDAAVSAVADKVDKVTGKDLSTNDFTDTLKTLLELKKVKSIATDALNDKLVVTYTDDTVANLNINDIVTDVYVSGATLDATTNVLTLTSTSGGADVAVNLSDFVNSSELISALAPINTSILELDTEKASTSHNHTGIYEPADATILKDVDIGSTVQGYNANTTLQGNTFNGVSQLVKLDGTGKLPAVDGSQLTNLPAGVTINNTLTSTSTTESLSANMGKTLQDSKQDTLVSGTTIKTIGGTSILGTGDIALNASGGTLIDDETESVNSTWSSNNINNNIKKAVLLHEILYHE